MAQEMDYTGDVDLLYKKSLEDLKKRALREASEGKSVKEEIVNSSVEQNKGKLLPKDPLKSDIDLATQLSISHVKEQNNNPSFISTVTEVAPQALASTVATAEWLLSPLNVFSSWALAPITHDYEHSSYFGQVGEALFVSTSAALKSLFPTWGEPSDNYAQMIADRALPNAPPIIRDSVGLTLDVALDPGLALGVGFAKTLQKGAQLTRAELIAGKQTTFKGMMTKGLQEILLTAPISEAERSTLLDMSMQVDAGEKAAAIKLNELLESPKYKGILKEAEKAEIDGFYKKLDDSFGFLNRDILNDGTVILSKEYKDQVSKIKKDVQKKYTKQAYSEYMANLKDQGIKGAELKRRLNEFEPLPKQFTKAEEDDISTLAQAAVRTKQVSKFNKYVEQNIILSKFDNVDFLGKSIENGNIFKAFKLRKGYITNENFPEAIQTLADSYRQFYIRYKNSDLTVKLLRDQAEEVPINNIVNKKPGDPWNPIETFVAKGVITSLKDEVFRLISKYQLTKNPYDMVAALQAQDMLKKVLVTEGDAGYVWGATGIARQIPFPDSMLEINNIKDMIEAVARVQDEGMARQMDVLAGYYLDAEEKGKGLNFISRVLKSPRIVEDILFESYVNANLSAITTSIKNVLSNTAMIAAQPAERFLSVPWGNTQGFQQGYQMALGLGEGVRDVLYFWLDKAAQSKFGGAILPERAADAAKMRMLNIKQSGIYPEAYLDPVNQPIHEALQVTKRKNLTAGNLGIDPNSWWGRRVDQSGKFVRLPGSILAYQDSVFKMVATRMKLREEAWNQAKRLAGNDRVGFEKYYREALVRPGQGATERANQFADYVTFQKALGATGSKLQSVMQMRATRWFFPYVRTPINLIKVGAERTPLNGFRGMYNVLKTGDKKAFQETMSRATLGSLIMAGAWTAFDDTEIVGGYDFRSEYGKRMRNLNIAPYSIKIDNQWHSFESVDFLRSTIGMVATAKRMLAQLDFENPDDIDTGDQIVAAVLVPFMQVSLDQRWLNDLGKIMYYIEAMRGSQGLSSGLATASEVALKDMGGIAASTIPGSRFLNQFENSFIDNESRAAETFLEELRRGIPGLSKDLPAYRNLKGDPFIADESVGPDMYSKLKSFVLPFKKSPDKTDIVSKEIFKVPVNLPELVRDIGGVKLSKREQIKIQEYTGKGVSGKALYDALEETINTDVYQNAHPLGKASLLQNVMSSYVDMAKQQLLADSEKNDPSMDSLFNRYMRHIEYQQNLLRPR